MENLFLEKSNKTPFIEFDANRGYLLIEGRSIPEDALDFYQPLFSWLDSYSKTAQEVTVMEFKLEYFNTSSSKCLVEILRRLEDINCEKHVEVKWFYEQDDEDMQESGEDYMQLVNVPISFEPY
ncbi:MAG: nuclear pore complex subunit [Thalassobius sp.]|nr:nuclear pore complex subunit [Thalassovita sp.]